MRTSWRQSLVIGAMAFGLLAGCSSNGEKISVGDGDIYYKDGATKEDAQKVADALVKDSFVDKSKTKTSKSIRVLKTGGKNVLELVVKDETFKDDGMLNLLRVGAGSDVAIEAFAGAPTELHLCDGSFATKKSVDVEFTKKATFGKGGTLKLTKDCSADETKNLTDWLTKSFEGSSDLLFFAKKEADTVVVLTVVAKEKWEKPEIKDGFKELAADLSKTLNGAKVRFDICDSNLVAYANATN